MTENKWKQQLDTLKARAIAAIGAYDGDRIITTGTKDFGPCRSVNRDDTVLLLPENGSPLLRSKKQLDREPDNTFWDRPLADMDVEEIIGIADELDVPVIERQDIAELKTDEAIANVGAFLDERLGDTFDIRERAEIEEKVRGIIKSTI